MEWVKKRGLSYPFSALSYNEDGSEKPRSALEFEMTGEVLSAFLKANALSHSLTLKVRQEEIENLKVQVKDGPRHDQSYFRWPFEEMTVKFVSKVDLEKDFSPVWDEDGEEEMGHDDVEEGSNVVVKFNLIFYLGRKAKGSDSICKEEEETRY